MSKGKFALKNVPQKVKDIAAFISAVLVIFTALIGAGHWIVKEVTASTNDRIDALEEKIENNDQESKQAITRLELMSLIQNDPTNVIEIEKLGRYYFINLGGDRWMSAVYSNWCKEYGGDPSIVVK